MYVFFQCYDLRMDVVRMIREGKGGHIGGDMSIMETMAVLYLDEMNVDPSRADDPDRDRFVLSKGHCVETYYAVLAAKGFLDIEEVIRKYSKFASPYIGHPNNKLPGIEMNSGSLGHGLPVGVGLLRAVRRRFCVHHRERGRGHNRRRRRPGPRGDRG